MKNLKFLNIALASCVAAQSAGLFAKETPVDVNSAKVDTTKTTTANTTTTDTGKSWFSSVKDSVSGLWAKTKAFCDNNKTTILASGATAGLGFLAGAFTHYKLTPKKTVAPKASSSLLLKTGLFVGFGALIATYAYLGYKKVSSGEDFPGKNAFRTVAEKCVSAKNAVVEKSGQLFGWLRDKTISAKDWLVNAFTIAPSVPEEPTEPLMDPTPIRRQEPSNQLNVVSMTAPQKSGSDLVGGVKLPGLTDQPVVSNTNTGELNTNTVELNTNTTKTPVVTETTNTNK